MHISWFCISYNIIIFLFLVFWRLLVCGHICTIICWLFWNYKSTSTSGDGLDSWWVFSVW